MIGILRRYVIRKRREREALAVAAAAKRMSALAHLPAKARRAATHAKLAGELGRQWP